MSARLFEVVSLDDECTRFACQRELYDYTYETIGDFTSEQEAQNECDILNVSVEAENEAIEEWLAPIYNNRKGGSQ